MTPTATDTDLDTIWALHRGFLEANRTGDWPFLEANMAPGADTLVWYNLNQSNYFGIEHIVDLWKMLATATGGKPARVEARDEQVTLCGDMALVTYLLDFEADFGALGHFAQQARDTEVWQRLAGEWKMIHFHCSNYVPGVMGGK
jgi:ketosteroid isomerase-like protein